MALDDGTPAPDFELVSQFGEQIRLSSFRGRRAVALVFFPLAFSAICRGELGVLRDNPGLFADSAVELIAISVDSRHTLRAWADQEGYGFTLLADFWPHGAVARAYDVFREGKGVADRATVLVDASGVIRSSFTTAPGEARSLAAYRAGLANLAKA